MSARVLRPRVEVCQLCDFMITRNRIIQQPYRPRRFLSTTHPATKSPKAQSKVFKASAPQRASKASQTVKAAPIASGAARFRPAATNVSQAELEQAVQEAQASCAKVLSQEAPPREQETLRALEACEQAANSLRTQDHGLPSSTTTDPASVFLSLGDAPQPTRQHHTSSIQSLTNELSHLARDLITAPQIFISPAVLSKYVSIQCSLHSPALLPEALHLYANKPLPVERTMPIRYTDQKPNKVANAVPATVAEQALQAAIDAKLLPFAMDIVDLTYGTTAFRRAKFVRKGLLPMTGLAVAPFAAYTAASQLALLQDTMDAVLATNLAFAGILAYVGFTATIGVVVVTTANDQMDRVTWAQGMPLRERWIREEERAAVDRMAGAWGFKERWRRGEEEGEEWEALREWAGRKGMIVDAAELMDGME